MCLEILRVLDKIKHKNRIIMKNKIIIDTKNWWGGKKVLISPHWIDRISWKESKVFINLSRESIKESPEYSDDFLLTREYEDQLHQHYKLKGYWIDEPLDRK